MQNETGRLLPDLFLFEKTLHKVKVCGWHFSFNIF